MSFETFLLLNVLVLQVYILYKFVFSKEAPVQSLPFENVRPDKKKGKLTLKRSERKKAKVYRQSQDIDAKMSGKIVDVFD